MTLAQTYAWIFYSIGLASQKLPCTLSGVENIADGINHAIPTQKEMQESLSWSVSHGLVSKEGKKLKLTTEGLALLNDALAVSSTTSGKWKYLEHRLTALGLDNSRQVNPKNKNKI